MIKAFQTEAQSETSRKSPKTVILPQSSYVNERRGDPNKENGGLCADYGSCSKTGGQIEYGFAHIIGI